MECEYFLPSIKCLAAAKISTKKISMLCLTNSSSCNCRNAFTNVRIFSVKITWRLYEKSFRRKYKRGALKIRKWWNLKTLYLQVSNFFLRSRGSKEKRVTFYKFSLVPWIQKKRNTAKKTETFLAAERFINYYFGLVSSIEGTAFTWIIFKRKRASKNNLHSTPVSYL